MRRVNDSVHWYINELTSRIVAQSGVPMDRYHLGKMIFQSLKDEPELVLQIDAATGESETSASVLERSVRCAIALKNLGLKSGDVMVIMAPNHLDLAIPFYAALYLGIAIAVIDRNMIMQELKGAFEIDDPKIVFCQTDRASDVQEVVNDLQMDTPIFTFDKGDDFCSFQEFLDQYQDINAVNDYSPSNFDTEDTIAFLVATSGTTGKSKSTALTHKNFAIGSPYIFTTFWNFPSPTRMVIVPAPLQWLTAVLQFVLTPILRTKRVQSSHPTMPKEHIYYMINTYRPTYMIISPTMMTSLLTAGDYEKCDFSSFEYILMGGSAVSTDLVDKLKGLAAPGADVLNVFGMSELSTLGLGLSADSPPGSSGKRMGCFQYRLIDINTLKDIDEPNKPGELWLKGPSVFKGYYKNVAATQETFAEDNWFRTGDLFYRDENWNYFFVERIKLLFKYKSLEVSPVELENIIRQHPGVLDVGVTGIPHPEFGNLPAACVIKQTNHDVTAQEIKDIIAEKVAQGILSDAKLLRGGVIFLKQLPLTPASKIDRTKLKKLASTMDRE